MFSGTVNPYEELVNKATDENLASEDWDTNLQITDKVAEDGTNGARNAIAALVKRLAHRNPNVQMYALELANTLAQNCGKPLHEELSSRTWTQALTRLVNDRSTAPPVQKQALKYIHDWAKQFEESGDANLALMGELYDQLRAKNMQFQEPEPAPEQTEENRRRAEEEELARVIELSKRDKGGWGSAARLQSGGGGSSSGAGSSSQAPAPVPKQNLPPYAQHQPQQQQQPQLQQQPQQPQQHQQQQYQHQQYQQQEDVNPYATPAAPGPEAVDMNTATRVRALYTFASAEFGELNFERGDIIKVLDRGFKEWWRGAVHGKIGIFPVVYVEALPEPTAQELQEEAQNESRLFASLGIVEQLLATLKEVDPARGDRVEDRSDIQEMYQSTVALQPQITALLKKYSDQKAELDHMNQGFIRAMRQYDDLTRGVAPGAGAVAAPPPGPAPYGYQQPAPQGSQDAYAQPAPQDAYAQPAPHDAYAHPAPHDAYGQQPPQQPPYAQQQPAQQPATDPYQQPAADPYQQPAADQYQQQQPQYPQPQPYQAAAGQAPTAFPAPAPAEHGQHGQQPGQFYYQQSQQQAASQASLGRQPSGAPSYPPSSPPPRQATNPGGAGLGAGADPAAEHAAAWDAYYRARGEQPPVGGPIGAPLVESPNLMGQPSQTPPQGAPQGQPQGQSQQHGQHNPFSQYGGYGVDNVAAGMNRMTVGQ